MAGLALILARDGTPIDPQRLEKLALAVAYRGHGLATWIDGPIGLAQVGDRLHATPTIAASPDGRWRAVCDGRLYNRSDIARTLGRPAPDGNGRDDAAIVAHACATWGAQAAARLRGELTCAAWHAPARELLLIRDARGLKPLYLRVDEREACVASDLRSLVRDRGAVPDEGMAAEWLTGAPASHRATLYTGIARLPMAHLAIVSERSFREWQYWTPEIDHAVRDQDAGARAAALAALLDETVQERCAAGTRVAVMLSGGLDSSSVAAAVARQARPWAAFTLAAADAADDERAFAARVARHLDTEHVIVPAVPVTMNDAAHDAAITLDIPSPPNGLESLSLRREAGVRGYGVALSGLGSDEWLSGSFLVYADMARRGAFVDLSRALWNDRKRDEPARIRVQLAAWAAMPAAVRDQLRRLRRRRPSLVSDGLAARTNLDERLRAADIAPPALDSIAQQALYAETTCGAYAAAIELQDRGNARCGLDERYPFHDRRMIEFTLSLPEVDRWEGGQSKPILRRAVAGRLPADVIARQGSPNANRVLSATLRSAGRPFFEHLAIAALGWVDHRRVLAAWDDFERTNTANTAWALWAIAAVELWWTHAVAGELGTVPHFHQTVTRGQSPVFR